MTATDPRRGAALFFVLTFAALLAGLVATISRSRMCEARAAVAFVDLAKADELGRAAANIMAYRLATSTANERRGGALDVHFSEAELHIDYLSESARIDVNAASAGLIGAVLSAAGAEPNDVAATMANIALLRGPAGAANPSGDAPAPVSGEQQPKAPTVSFAAQTSAPTTAFQTVAEALKAWNVSASLAQRLSPALTTISGSAHVDPILAGRLVVAALVGPDESRIDDFLARRMKQFTDANSATALLQEPSRAFVSFDDVDSVRAIARVTVKGRMLRRYEILLAPPTLPSEPPVVVEWRTLP